jgi:hypothetical protein
MRNDDALYLKCAESRTYKKGIVERSGARRENL